ncbi:hypothetical protein HYPSUDRAFT_150220 [Hypholoma sublateritium FD-334 SS-4]|uniref:PIH1 N-terminal domain-containing protein n=1 Tax=Hypholoma sublateritium (strain FD-334 SS-4) TaxID=945553 RepID=A0A0D2LUS1_HYPSF|nr:hypothetical protein HYPSUDRAFT_150220 [Hypholoma sublateritium FD-334 SS-4]
MASSSSSTIEIQLSPKPGFCIKTSTLAGAVIPAVKESTSPSSPSVPEGLKVFVNIAWDTNVPPSPQGSEEAILRAIHGEDVEEADAAGFYIPAIVSSPREEKDKAGNPSLVFDCIYNTTLKARLFSDPEVKIFLVELSLQRIESKTGLILSREVKTPNISSKGRLFPRTAQVPAALLLETPLAATSPTGTLPVSVSSLVAKPSIEVLPVADNEIPINIHPVAQAKVHETTELKASLPPLDWCWSKDQGGRLRIEVNVPDITSSLMQASTLDVEPRRLEFFVPGRGSLDIDLDLSDAAISSRIKLRSTAKLEDDIEPWMEGETIRQLQLKRERDFEVEEADARWITGTQSIIIYL